MSKAQAHLYRCLRVYVIGSRTNKEQLPVRLQRDLGFVLSACRAHSDRQAHGLGRHVLATLPALSGRSMAPIAIGLGWTKVRMPSRRQRSAASSGTTILSYSLICLDQEYVNMMPRHMQSTIDTCMVCRWVAPISSQYLLKEC